MAIVFPDGTQSYPGNTVRGSEHALNTNSAVTWTGIPQHVQKITISWRSMSHNSTARILVRLGDSSSTGYYSANYEGTSQHINQSGGAGGRRESSGFEIYGGTAASYYNHGHATLTLLDDGQVDTWVWSYISGQRNSEHISHGGGYKSLGSGYYLDSVQLLPTSGSFDSGYATLQYHF